MVLVMKHITWITLAAVRNGEPLESIKDLVLDGLISAALIKNYGSQAATARQLHVHRDAVRKRCKVPVKAIESTLTYREAWHHISRVAVMEAIGICGGNRTLAKDHLKCSKFVVWRYSREHD